MSRDELIKLTNKIDSIKSIIRSILLDKEIENKIRQIFRGHNNIKFVSHTDKCIRFSLNKKFKNEIKNRKLERKDIDEYIKNELITTLNKVDIRFNDIIEYSNFIVLFDDNYVAIGL